MRSTGFFNVDVTFGIALSTRKAKINNHQFLFSVPMVSSDGEPHEILTLIAVGTGLVAAVIVLIFLIILIDCTKRYDAIPCTNFD